MPPPPTTPMYRWEDGISGFGRTDGRTARKHNAPKGGGMANGIFKMNTSNTDIFGLQAANIHLIEPTWGPSRYKDAVLTA